MKKFVLIGAAGFIAPKHMKAIKDVGGDLIAITDPNGSVGIIDSFFPNARYFNSFERFERFCSREKVDYVSICSPNYLHDTHCRFAVNIGASAICEKPLVLNSKNLNALMKYKHKIFTIMQLRYNLEIKALHDNWKAGDHDRKSLGHLEYVTPRGLWYEQSWKGNKQKSGGLATNIGVHLFDALTWIFGVPYTINLDKRSPHTASGRVIFKGMDMTFNLSIKGTRVTRVLNIGEHQIDMSSGFLDLHTRSYQEILNGNGFTIDDARPSIELCEIIRNM